MAKALDIGVPGMDSLKRLVFGSCVVLRSLAPEPDQLHKLPDRPGAHRLNLMCLARKRSTFP